MKVKIKRMRKKRKMSNKEKKEVSKIRRLIKKKRRATMPSTTKRNHVLQSLIPPLPLSFEQLVASTH